MLQQAKSLYYYSPYNPAHLNWTTEPSLNCAVPENIDTPPQKGLEFPGGDGGEGVCKAKKFKEIYED